MTDKWIWMIDYCKRKNIPLTQGWAWKEAENAYRTYIGWFKNEN